MAISTMGGATRPSGQTALARAVRGGSVYIGLSLVQRVVPFLVLPILATALSPSEYGRIAFLVAVVAVLGALLGVGLEPWVVRTYVHLRDTPEEAANFLKTIGLFAFAVPTLGALAAGIAFTVVPALIALEADTTLLGVALIGMAAQVMLSTFIGAVLRAQERLTAYATIALVQGVGGPILSTIFVVGLHLGALGWFLAAMGSALAALATGLALVRPPRNARFSPRFVVLGLAFGLPLLPHALSHWVLNLSDRLVLTAFVGQSDVGVYNLAYQLVAPVGLVLIALRQGLMPLYAQAHTDADIREEISKMATIQVHITALGGLVAAALGPGVLWLLFPSGYYGGEQFIPWIALGFVLFGLYLIPVDSLSLMLGRTRWIWVPTVVAAAINVVANVLMVPSWGAQAAAVNTAVAYGCLLAGVVILRRAERGPRITYNVPRMVIGMFVAGGAWVVATAIVPSTATFESLAVRSSVVVAAAILLLVYDTHWWRTARMRNAMQPPRPEPSDTGLVRMVSE